MKKALIPAIIITAIGVVFAIVFPGRENYLLLPGWLSVYALSGGVHGDGPLESILSHSFLLYALVGTCNVLIFAGLALVVVKTWQNLRAFFP